MREAPMRLNNKLICAAGIASALFAGQALLRILREMRTMGGEAEILFYLALWSVLYAVIVCGLKLREYGTRRLMLAGSCLLLLVTLPPSNMMLQGVMGMAVCMIFVSRLTYRPGDDKNATRQSSRLRDMLARAKK